jgi:hypothetical protein
MAARSASGGSSALISPVPTSAICRLSSTKASTAFGDVGAASLPISVLMREQFASALMM